MADIYKVAVGIALTSNYAEVLGAMAGQLRGIDGQVQGLIGKWDSLGASMRSTLTGLAQIAGGLALGGIVAKITEAGGELVKFQGQLQNLGKSAADIRADTDSAMQAQIAVHGTNAAENLKVLRELSGITSTSEDARSILQSVLRDSSVVGSMMGSNPSDAVQTLVKTAELRGDGIDPLTGKLDPARLAAAVHQEVATLVAAGGLIKPGDMLQMVQQAGPMARMYTDAGAFWQSQITAMMDMGGRRAGTADTALGRQLFGEKMSLPTAQAMEDYGLYSKGSVGKAGTGVKIDGPLLGEAILKGPGGLQAWTEGVLLPAMVAHGKTTADSQQQELYRIFGTETARRMAGLFLTSQAQVEKDAGLQRAAAGQDLYGNMMGTDLGANTAGLSSAIGGLMQVLGAPMVKPAIAGINAITNAVNSLMGTLAAHPDIAKTLGPMAGFSALALTGMGAKNLYDGIFGGGGLKGSAAALDTSAKMLQEAAVSLGAKGKGGLGGDGAGGSSVSGAGLGWRSFLMGNLLIGGAMNMPSDMDEFRQQLAASKKQSDAVDSWWQAHAPTWMQTLTNTGAGAKTILPTNPDGSVKLFSSDDLHKGVAEMHWNGGHGNIGGGLDLSKAKLPPAQVQIQAAPTTVTLDGRAIGQFVQKFIVKAGSIIGGTSSFDGTAQPRPAGQ